MLVRRSGSGLNAWWYIYRAGRILKSGRLKVSGAATDSRRQSPAARPIHAAEASRCPCVVCSRCLLMYVFTILYKSTQFFLSKTPTKPDSGASRTAMARGKKKGQQPKPPQPQAAAPAGAATAASYGATATSVAAAALPTQQGQVRIPDWLIRFSQMIDRRDGGRWIGFEGLTTPTPHPTSPSSSSNNNPRPPPSAPTCSGGRPSSSCPVTAASCSRRARSACSPSASWRWCWCCI